ncbi:hypothetical protein ACQKP8_23490 [Photobacterium alginatilyticum]|uniref:hypothetical protein n=1 Tax=Photobacterium alginatilyticum TaxID=1775171 RepID=UPI004068FB87
MNKAWCLIAGVISFYGHAAEWDLTGSLHSQGWYATQLKESDYRLRLDTELEYKPSRAVELVVGGWLQQSDIRPQQRTSGWNSSSLPAQIELAQAFVRYRKDDHEWTIGRQYVDWRVTDTISVADVWAPRDFSDVLDPQSLALPALRWRWFGSLQLDMIYSPEFSPSRLPTGIWQQEAIPLLPQDSSAVREQLGMRISRNWRQQDLAIYGYRGYGYSPAARLETGGIRPYYERQHILGGTWVSPLDGSALLRSEIGYVWQENSDDYLQWVLALEKEFFEVLGEQDHWLLLLQTANEKVMRAGEQLPGWVDFRRVFRDNLMGRISWDPQGDEELQLIMEWSIDTANNGQYWELSTKRRLNDYASISLSWQQLSGSEQSFWGRYNDRDRVGVSVMWVL